MTEHERGLGRAKKKKKKKKKKPTSSPFHLVVFQQNIMTVKPLLPIILDYVIYIPNNTKYNP